MDPFQNQFECSFYKDTHSSNLCIVYITHPANNDMPIGENVAMVTEGKITPASHLIPHLMFPGVCVYTVLQFVFIILNTICYLHLLCYK